MFKHTLLFLSTILGIINTVNYNKVSVAGLTITLLAASSLAEDPGTDRMKITLCGNQLVGMLNIICSLNFDSPSGREERGEGGGQKV